MNRKVVLSKTAEKQLNKLLDYLESEWSTKVKLKFLSKLENTLQIVVNDPMAFPESKI